MKLKFCLFVILFVVVNSTVINRNIPPLETPTDTPPCSTNASSAYVDIILVIDTSANMGASNLRKISTTLALILPKFTIGNQIDITAGFRNTRIAIVTFDTEAKIVANYSDINNSNDVYKALNGLTASTSQEANLYEGIAKAFYIQTNCSDVNQCQISFNYMRPTAMIIFAAAANSNNVSQDPNLIFETDFFDMGTVITVNFNTANAGLTDLLQNVTHNFAVNASMYNFTGSSKTLVNDLQWAILQANCYCGDLDGVATVYYDTTSGRYTRSADCLSMRTSGGYDTMDMCANGHIPVIPAFVLSPAKQTFIQGVWGGIDNSVIGNLPYTFYFGLHRNIQMQWMFYDYDKNDFPVTSYTNWGPGYPNGTAQCAKLNSNDGVLVWENYGCNSDATGLSKVLCQGKACDATSTSCCQYCNGNGFEIKEKKPKSRTGKRNKKRLFS